VHVHSEPTSGGERPEQVALAIVAEVLAVRPGRRQRKSPASQSACGASENSMGTSGLESDETWVRRQKHRTGRLGKWIRAGPRRRSLTRVRGPTLAGKPTVAYGKNDRLRNRGGLPRLQRRKNDGAPRTMGSESQSISHADDLPLMPVTPLHGSAALHSAARVAPVTRRAIFGMRPLHPY
jgi:hypothetical protein